MLRPRKPREVLSILLKQGFEEKRQTGSHIVLRRDSSVVILPFHGGKDIPMPTLKSIIKQAGLSEDLFI